MRTRLLPFLLAVLAFAAPGLIQPAAAHAQSSEYIILVGGPSIEKWEKFKTEPHDVFWGSFIRAARTRVQQLRQTTIPIGSPTQLTLLVYRKGYVTRGRQDNRDLVGLVNSVRDTYKVNLVWFNSGGEVFNYFNGGKPRGSVKVSGFEFFGHSNRACFMFDYSNEVDSCSKAWMQEDELARLSRSIWAPKAYVKSWGCHTGESMSQKFYDATGVKMIGAIGKTTYASRIENQGGILNGIVPTLSSSGGSWTN